MNTYMSGNYEFFAFIAGVFTGLYLALAIYCWNKFFDELFKDYFTFKFFDKF